MTLVAKILTSILSILPGSPFKAMIVAIDDIQILGALNWIIPFAPIVSMLQTWAVCMAAYYAYKVAKKGLSGVLKKLLS